MVVRVAEGGGGEYPCGLCAKRMTPLSSTARKLQHNVRTALPEQVRASKPVRTDPVSVSISVQPGVHRNTPVSKNTIHIHASPPTNVRTPDPRLATGPSARVLRCPRGPAGQARGMAIPLESHLWAPIEAPRRRAETRSGGQYAAVRCAHARCAGDSAPLYADEQHEEDAVAARGEKSAAGARRPCGRARDQEAPAQLSSVACVVESVATACSAALALASSRSRTS